MFQVSKKLFLIMMVAGLGLGLGCTGKSQASGPASSSGTGSAEVNYLGKYEPAITYSTVRQLNNTIL
jgi:hypothetical protein